MTPQSLCPTQRPWTSSAQSSMAASSSRLTKPKRRSPCSVHMVLHYLAPTRLSDPVSYKASIRSPSSSPGDLLVPPRMCQEHPPHPGPSRFWECCPQDMDGSLHLPPFPDAFSVPCSLCCRRLASKKCFPQAPLSSGFQPGSTDRAKRTGGGGGIGLLLQPSVLFLLGIWAAAEFRHF